MDKEVKVSVQVQTSDMYNFMMHHAYRGVSTIAGTIISIIAFVLLVTGFGGESVSQNVLLLLVALLFTVINPIQLYLKSVKQIKLLFKEPLEYVLNEKGITVSQGKESMQKPWSDVKKVVETGKNIIIYMSNVGAYLLTKQSLDDNYDEVMKVLLRNLNKKSVKLKLKS